MILVGFLQSMFQEESGNLKNKVEYPELSPNVKNKLEFLGVTFKKNNLKQSNFKNKNNTILV